MKVTALGDSALIVEFVDETFDPSRLLTRALVAAQALERAKIPGVIEVTSAYQSVALYLDLPRVAAAAAGETIASFLSAQITSVIGSTKARSGRKMRVVEIPTCYDDEFALDLSRVAEHTKLSKSQIARLHSATEFVNACIGFMPGFPYLAGLPEQLHTPRLDDPRTRVPAGSVAIAGTQAGIYPFESPGGWNVIGRTPLRLFDASVDPPTLLRVGDHVRFRAISGKEFDALGK